MIQTRYCRKHPRVKAGWYCNTCSADLCPDCVATHALGHRQAPMEVCCQCRRAVKPLTVHRADLVRFWHRVLDAPKYPLGTVGLVSLAGLGFVRALTSYVGFMSMLTMGGAVFLLRQGLYWAFIFFIIRDSAQGASKMGVFGFRDIQSDVVVPAIKGLLSTALVWLPAAVYIAMVSEEGVLGILSYEGNKDPIVWLLGIVGILYGPMALLAGATDLGFGYILNPIRIFSFIRRMGRDYFVAIGAIAVVVVFGRIVDHLLGLALSSVGIPFLPRWLAETVSLYPAFVAARVLGLLLFTRGEALDWGRAEEYQVPVLAGVRPRGVLHNKPPARESVAAAALVPAAAPAPAKQEPRSIPLFDPQVGPLSPGTIALDDAEPRVELAAEGPSPALALHQAQLLDLPDLPPLGLGPSPVEAPAFASESGMPPVDLPPAREPNPPRVALSPSPQAGPYPTIRGFAPASEKSPAPPQPRLDLGVTRVGRSTHDAHDQATTVSPDVRAPPRDGPSLILVRAVEEARLDEALRMYRELPGQDGAIPAHVHMAVGREASRVRDFEVAVHAFRQVALGQSEHAGVALVSLAQVMGDGERDSAAAVKLYREAIKRFPGTEVAAFAERKLASLKA
jgi:hypothetical protein